MQKVGIKECGCCYWFSKRFRGILRYRFKDITIDPGPLEVKEVSDGVKYLGEFPVLTENITLVLGRVTPVKTSILAAMASLTLW